MEIIEGFSNLALGLLVLIVLMTVWFAGPGYNSHSVNHSPTILTSTGIFGTFLGVALGLLDFDTANIQESVPALISGLKTAFWTSIVGLLGSLVVKFRHLAFVLRQRKFEEQYTAATITDLANLLGDIRDSLSDPKADGLRAALTVMQTEQNQHLEGFKSSLEVYQEKMTEANSKAFIVAIEAVLRDFNTQINEQYGDNFKELNQAVGNMLLWQKNYKVELEKLLTTQQSNGELLDKASHAYEKMVAHSEIFTEVSSSLGTMLEALQSQSAGMDQYLTKLAEVAVKASSGLPLLEGRIDSLTTNLAKSMTESQQQLSGLLTESAQSMKQTSETINQTLASTLEDSQQGLHDRIEKMVDRTEKQVMRLDDAMEDELTKALKTFGYQLTSLSEKFVNDYTPLTDRLRQLIQISEQTSSDKRNDSTSEKRTRISAQ